MIKIVGLGLFIYLFLVVSIFIDSNEDKPLKAEYAVVLGNKVELTGEPSTRLEYRLLAALELYERKAVEKIIVSGGIGKEGYDEAEVMAQYLIVKGVKPESIIIDSEGYNTQLTAQSAQRLIVSLSAPVIVVSQQYHVSRAKLSFRNAGFTNVYGHYPRYYELRDVYAYTREIPAWAKYWLLGL